MGASGSKRAAGSQQRGDETQREIDTLRHLIPLHARSAARSWMKLLRKEDTTVDVKDSRRYLKVLRDILRVARDQRKFEKLTARELLKLEETAAVAKGAALVASLELEDPHVPGQPFREAYALDELAGKHRKQVSNVGVSLLFDEKPDARAIAKVIAYPMNARRGTRRRFDQVDDLLEGGGQDLGEIAEQSRSVSFLLTPTSVDSSQSDSSLPNQVDLKQCPPNVDKTGASVLLVFRAADTGEDYLAVGINGHGEIDLMGGTNDEVDKTPAHVAAQTASREVNEESRGLFTVPLLSSDAAVRAGARFVDRAWQNLYCHRFYVVVIPVRRAEELGEIVQNFAERVRKSKPDLPEQFRELRALRFPKLEDFLEAAKSTGTYKFSREQRPRQIRDHLRAFLRESGGSVEEIVTNFPTQNWLAVRRHKPDPDVDRYFSGLSKGNRVVDVEITRWVG